MRNFIIFFDEKSGTSPLVRLLDQFRLITIVHQVNNSGFEPFDRHNCGRMRLNDLRRCFNIIFKHGSRNHEKLNRIYTRTAKKPLEVIPAEGIVGLKMRFTPPMRDPFQIDGLSAWNAWAERRLTEVYTRKFERTMIDTLRRHGVVVLMAIRQDVLRLGLSKYHGDGTGKPGHLQFKLAKGAIKKNDIGKMNVDCQRLEEIITQCERRHDMKRHHIEEFRQAGLQVHPILYEDFLADRRSYLQKLFQYLELDIAEDEMAHVLSQEEYLKKVHSHDISEFVENHEEIMSRFGDRYVSWR